MLPRLALRRQLFTRGGLIRSYTTHPAKLDTTPKAVSEAEIEEARVAEHTRTMQAPNRVTVWSGMQNPRGVAMVGPRFEQTELEAQVHYIFGFPIYLLRTLQYPGYNPRVG